MQGKTLQAMFIYFFNNSMTDCAIYQEGTVLSNNTDFSILRIQTKSK